MSSLCSQVFKRTLNCICDLSADILLFFSLLLILMFDVVQLLLQDCLKTLVSSSKEKHIICLDRTPTGMLGECFKISSDGRYSIIRDSMCSYVIVLRY